MSRRKRNVKLSQVFLKDKNIINKIVHCLNITKDETIVEIGGGEGAITFPILKKEAKLIVFEKDDILREKLLKKAIELHFHDRIVVLGDFLKFDFSLLERLYGLERVKLVGNIPYHITGMVLRKVIKEHKRIGCAYLMMQKEVAERLTAKPSTKEYGALTVLAQALFDVQVMFDIKPGSFSPVPKVTSSFIKMSPRDDSKEVKEHFKEFERIVKIAFSSRRKKLKNTLFSSLNIEMPEYENLRAEDLSIEDYIGLLKNFY